MPYCGCASCGAALRTRLFGNAVFCAERFFTDTGALPWDVRHWRSSLQIRDRCEVLWPRGYSACGAEPASR